MPDAVFEHNPLDDFRQTVCLEGHSPLFLGSHHHSEVTTHPLCKSIKLHDSFGDNYSDKMPLSPITARFESIAPAPLSEPIKLMCAF